MAKTLPGRRVSLAPLEPQILSQNLSQVSFLQRRGSGCSLMALTQNCQSNDIVVLQLNLMSTENMGYFSLEFTFLFYFPNVSSGRVYDSRQASESRGYGISTVGCICVGDLKTDTLCVGCRRLQTRCCIHGHQTKACAVILVPISSSPFVLSEVRVRTFLAHV